MPRSAAENTEPNDDGLRRIYAETKTIAVVGMSGDPSKLAHTIPRYLQAQGYRILPVSPRGGEILGELVYPSLEEVAQEFDVVDVFRPPQEAGDVARSAARSGAKVLWFQPGTATEEAVAMAREAGLTVVSGRCLGETHGRLGLGPGPYA
jgi:uncharacterized protein